MKHLSLGLLAAMFLPVALAAQTPAPDHAFARARHLERGINASIWFAQSANDYSVERLRTFTTPDDIALMHKLGFDHVRLSIDADPLTKAFRTSAGPRPAPGAPFLAELDKAVHTMLDEGLSVIIDVHPEDDYKMPLKQGQQSVQKFAELWRQLATHYAATDPEHVFFEIMNEPEQDDPYRWQGIEAYVAQQIRRAAPQHTIIAAGAHYSGIEDLLHLEPLPLDNIIYTFHDYEPFPFTHQGATWTDPAVRPLRGVPYPSTPDNVEPNEAQEPTLAGKYFVEEYGLGQWNAERVDRTLRFAELWSEEHHAPVYCGEFGVLRYYANPQMRAEWVRDMRTALEKHHIGWAMWDYQTNFGVVSKENGKTVPDQTIVDALGLKAAPQ